MKHLKVCRSVLLTIAVAALGVVCSGCSPQERSGVSPIPQNRPTTWENQQIAR